jgi:hypothetical protein
MLSTGRRLSAPSCNGGQWRFSKMATATDDHQLVVLRNALSPLKTKAPSTCEPQEIQGKSGHEPNCKALSQSALKTMRNMKQDDRQPGKRMSNVNHSGNDDADSLNSKSKAKSVLKKFNLQAFKVAMPLGPLRERYTVYGLA